MRFGLFLRVPWWLMLFVLVVELAAWIVIFPFWLAWRLYDRQLAKRDDAALGIIRPARPPGFKAAYRDWADRHLMP